MKELSDYKIDHIGVRAFPPFVRMTLGKNARKELFSQSMKGVGKIKKEYTASEDIYCALYGEKKGKILKMLSENPQNAVTLIEESGLSPSAVYHFLSFLRKQHIISKKGRTYYLEKLDFDELSLDEIVKIEEDPLLRRKYGISIRELELAYFLWNRFLEVAPEEGGYARTYQSEYTLADAIHRWRTGRTDTPVWALERLVELAESDILERKGNVHQYHIPPGIPVHPYINGEYKLPVKVDITLDKVVMQLLQKMSKNHLYTFPKRKKWLFENLHNTFGEFDDSTSRIPSAIVEILKSYYEVRTLDRTSARIPFRIKARLEDLNPLFRIKEESLLLLHIISLSSRSNGGFEITSRSKSFLQDLSRLASDLGLGTLNIRKKHSRPHFRAYLSENKMEVLKRYVHLFQEYPDLEIWLRIPLNQIAQKLISTGADASSVERICQEELSRFVESILKSLERRKKAFSGSPHYVQYVDEITHYFWQEKLIPSSRRVEELVDIRGAEEELLYYA
ncbi:MAG: helix-turn-helix transcriptional regulator [Theionarchaea archaeon]|nr:helix-turn-helix transcriptional regulator [Theionarchaea archaeon]